MLALEGKDYKKEQFVIDLVPYDVYSIVFSEEAETRRYIIHNFLGEDGIEFLKRRDRSAEASGYTLDGCFVAVEKEKLLIICKEEEFEDCLLYLLRYYPSIGWECLSWKICGSR